jgi:Flp pilus assembly pilin Flp
MKTYLTLRFRRDDAGSSSVEYALLAAFIAIVIIGAVILFGGATTGLFEKTCSSMPHDSSCT